MPWQIDDATYTNSQTRCNSFASQLILRYVILGSCCNTRICFAKLCACQRHVKWCCAFWNVCKNKVTNACVGHFASNCCEPYAKVACGRQYLKQPENKAYIRLLSPERNQHVEEQATIEYFAHFLKPLKTISTHLPWFLWMCFVIDAKFRNDTGIKLRKCYVATSWASEGLFSRWSIVEYPVGGQRSFFRETNRRKTFFYQSVYRQK